MLEQANSDEICVGIALFHNQFTIGLDLRLDDVANDLIADQDAHLSRN